MEWEQQQILSQSKSGIIVGYGKSEDSDIHELTPRILENVPIYSLGYCFLTNINVGLISSERTFCAAGKGISACKGDSGGGIYEKIDETSYLRGIVASKIGSDSCDIVNPGIFTNVIKFKDWIIDGIDELQVETTQCGIMSSTKSLIQRGFLSERDQFPWMALVEANYRTSGVLVSHKHVIAIATSVRQWNSNTKKWEPLKDLNRVFITLGIIEIGNDYSVKVHPSKIVLHPKSEIYHHQGHATINFAILTLKRVIQDFNNFVKPVCILSSNLSFEELQSTPMYVVGYGNDEFGKKSNTRKYAKVTPLDDEECSENFSGSTENTFIKKTKSFFCAKGNSKGNPCHEDESIFIKKDGIWYFQGFTVFRKPFKNPEICEKTPILFEGVQPYADWIKNETRENLEEKLKLDVRINV